MVTLPMGNSNGGQPGQRGSLSGPSVFLEMQYNLYAFSFDQQTQFSFVFLSWVTATIFEFSFNPHNSIISPNLKMKKQVQKDKWLA